MEGNIRGVGSGDYGHGLGDTGGRGGSVLHIHVAAGCGQGHAVVEVGAVGADGESIACCYRDAGTQRMASYL